MTKLQFKLDVSFKKRSTNEGLSLSIFIQNWISSGLLAFSINLFIAKIDFSILLVLKIIDIIHLQ